MLKVAAGVAKDPPFVRCNECDVLDRLKELVSDYSHIIELQERSVDYFTRYLTPERLGRIYANIYRQVLHA